MLAINSTMEAPMGKTFALFSTDPIVQRRLREAHEARNAYPIAALPWFGQVRFNSFHNPQGSGWAPPNLLCPPPRDALILVSRWS